MNVHNTVSDVLSELDYANIINDHIHHTDENPRFWYVTFSYRNQAQRCFTIELFIDDDGDYSAMEMESHDFSRAMKNRIMDSLMDKLNPNH